MGYMMYPKIQQKLKDSGRYELEPKEIEEIRTELTEAIMEEQRKKVFELFDIKTDESHKKVLQKAYLKYSTVVREEGGEGIRATWQSQVTHEQKVHLELCDKLFKGEAIPGIESDPLLDREPDF